MKREKKKEHLLSSVIPPSALIGESKITLNSNKEALIEGCRNIIEYEDDRIKLNLGNKTLLIIGSGLSIETITINGVMVKGTISSVEF